MCTDFWDVGIERSIYCNTYSFGCDIEYKTAGTTAAMKLSHFSWQEAVSQANARIRTLHGSTPAISWRYIVDFCGLQVLVLSLYASYRLFIWSLTRETSDQYKKGMFEICTELFGTSPQELYAFASSCILFSLLFYLIILPFHSPSHQVRKPSPFLSLPRIESHFIFPHTHYSSNNTQVDKVENTKTLLLPPHISVELPEQATPQPAR